MTGPLRAAGIAPIWLFCRHFQVLEANLLELPAASPPPLELHWQRLGAEHARDIAALNPLLQPDEFARRIDQGFVCFGVLQAGELVHYRWYATAPVWLPFLRIRWVPAPGDYTALDVFTVPRTRRKGLHYAISFQGLDRARELGMKRCISFIAWWNEPSLAVVRRLGFTLVGSATLWRVGPLSLHSATRGVRIEGGELTVLSR